MPDRPAGHAIPTPEPHRSTLVSQRGYYGGTTGRLRWGYEGISARIGRAAVHNRPEDPQYILRLIAQVITVSLETVRIVKSLPPLVTVH